MTEVYRKSGVSAIVEMTDGHPAIYSTVSECGIAIEDAAHFAAFPDHEGVRLPAGDPSFLKQAVAGLQRTISPLVTEQLTLVSGRIEHSIESETTFHRWRESGLRLHLALARRDIPVRAVIDLAADAPEAFLNHVQAIVSALSVRHEMTGRRTGVRLLIDAPASAQLLPLLAQNRIPAGAAKRTKILQDQHPTRTHDGRGVEILRTPITGAGGEERPPNVFRPSYRFRPFPAWFHVRASGEPDAENASFDLEAVSVSGLPAVDGSQIVVPLLCVDRSRGTCSSAVVAFRAEEWLERMRVVGDAREWFPVSAGVWGAKLLIEGAAIRDQEI